MVERIVCEIVEEYHEEGVGDLHRRRGAVLIEAGAWDMTSGHANLQIFLGHSGLALAVFQHATL